MLCQKCGAENDNDSKFCTQCGAALSKDQELQNNQTVPNIQPEMDMIDGIAIRIKALGGGLGLILLIVGIIGVINVLCSHHGKYQGDYQNEIIGLLWGIKMALYILISASGILIEVLASNYKDV